MGTRALLSSLVFGLLFAGLTLSACGGDDSTEAGSGDMSDSMGHDHDALFEVPDGTTAPTLSIELIEDTVSGYNVHIETTNFTIAPEAASTEAVMGEGHFHIYVDGTKVSRFYNPDFHLKGLSPGDHEVKVELSANNHSVYAVDGEPIEVVETISVSESSDGAMSGHMHHDPIEATGTAPTITLTATPDPKAGWNLHADVDNFTFAPRHAGAKPLAGEGHLHLYVDGEKVARLYGEWWHLPPMTEGTHEVLVEVNANNHAPWAVDGEPIRATTTIEVTAEQAAAAMEMMGHGSNGDHSHDHDSMHGTSNQGETLDMAASDADVVIEVTIADGTVTINSGGDDADRVEVDEGQSVGVVVTSDVTDAVHVHGFDVYVDVADGSPGEVAFTAADSGLFEVELEDQGRFLFELAVR